MGSTEVIRSRITAKQLFRALRRRLLDPLTRPLLNWYQDLVLRLVSPQEDYVGVVVHGGHTLSGNPRALADALIQHTNCHVVIAGESIDDTACNWVNSQPTGRAYWTPKFGARYARCRHVFLTHGGGGPPVMRKRADPNRSYFLLWHGVGGGKRLELNPPSWATQFSRRYKAFLAPSDAEYPEIQPFLGLEPEKFWVCGYPRIDHLTAPRPDLPRDLREALAALEELRAGRKLVLWAPTYEPFRERRVDPLGIIAHLVEAIDGRAILGLRLHRNVRPDALVGRFPQGVIDLTHVSSTEIVLRETDVLVTDFSSIRLDFEVLQRPIVGYAPYLEHYVATGRVAADIMERFGSRWANDPPGLRTHISQALDASDRKSRPHPTLFHEHIHGNANRVVRVCLPHLT